MNDSLQTSENAFARPAGKFNGGNATYNKSKALTDVKNIIKHHRMPYEKQTKPNSSKCRQPILPSVLPTSKCDVSVFGVYSDDNQTVESEFGHNHEHCMAAMNEDCQIHSPLLPEVVEFVGAWSNLLRPAALRKYLYEDEIEAEPELPLFEEPEFFMQRPSTPIDDDFANFPSPLTPIKSL